MQEGKVNLTQVDQNQVFAEQTFPTHIIQLPSKGRIYPITSLLTQGSVELKAMTTKEENILTTESYIRDNTVIDKFLQSLVISPKFNYDQLLIGDKNALIIASRIYGYGEMYDFKVTTPSGDQKSVTIDLRNIEFKELDESLISPNENVFTYFAGKTEIKFKLLTVGDEKTIESKLKTAKKAGKEDKQISTRLEQTILSINGNDDPMFIRDYLENQFLARDSREFRNYIASITPGPEMEIELVDEATGLPFRSKVTIESGFFWPDARI